MPTANRGNARPPVATKNVSDVAPYGGWSGDNAPFPDMYTAELIARLRNGEEIRIKAPLPENYQFQLGTNFDNPFNQPISNLASNFGNGLGQTIGATATGSTALTGHSDINKWMSGAKWAGGSLFEVTVPFVIQAFENTRTEVVDVMRDMLKLVAPSESIGGMLIAPGPSAASTFGLENLGDDITIRIGKFFTMRPCVIDSVTCDFDTQMDVDNEAPLSATITVSAKSYWATTKEDLDTFFRR